MSIISNAIVEVDGKEYRAFGINLNGSGNGITIYKSFEMHELNFDRGFTYNGVLTDENGFLEYSCKAMNENGHIKHFILKFPSKNVNIIRTS